MRMKHINLCNHPVVVGRTTIPPSGRTLRIAFEKGEPFYLNGIRHRKAPVYHGLVQEGDGPDYDLTDPNTIYIVSQLVAFRYPQPNFYTAGGRAINKDNSVRATFELVCSC